MKHPSDYPCLLLSIQHWQDNQEHFCEYKPYSSAPADCACCSEILSRTNGVLLCDLTDPDGEFICPIYAYTNRGSCAGTPYEAIIGLNAPPQTLVDWLTALYRGEEPELVDKHNNPTDRSYLL